MFIQHEQHAPAGIRIFYRIIQQIGNNQGKQRGVAPDPEQGLNIQIQDQRLFLEQGFMPQRNIHAQGRKIHILCFLHPFLKIQPAVQKRRPDQLFHMLDFLKDIADMHAGQRRSGGIVEKIRVPAALLPLRQHVQPFLHNGRGNVHTGQRGAHFMRHVSDNLSHTIYIINHSMRHTVDGPRHLHNLFRPLLADAVFQIAVGYLQYLRAQMAQGAGNAPGDPQGQRAADDDHDNDILKEHQIQRRQWLAKTETDDGVALLQRQGNPGQIRAGLRVPENGHPLVSGQIFQ